MAQLRKYAFASPGMHDGFAVLTNGVEWRLYCMAKSGPFVGRLTCTVNIMDKDVCNSATTLDRWLSSGAV